MKEAKFLTEKVTLSGHSKQDYTISSILEKILLFMEVPMCLNLHDELMHFTSIYGTKGIRR